MELSFVETMRGSLVDERGHTSAIEFDVKARARSLRRFLRDGRTELSGLVRAAPFADEAVVAGLLTLSPTLLHYALRFRGADGNMLLLDGKKHPSVFDPVRTMTEMPVTLSTAEGARLAVGTMRFDVRELPAFLRTWLPCSRTAQRALDARRRSLERRWLDGELGAAPGGRP